MSPEKPLPLPTPQNLLPPSSTYHYFEGARQRPFRANAVKCDPVNAWWLAEAAFLAYWDEPNVRRCYEQAGMATVKFLHGASTECYVASNENFGIVSFRGTQVAEPNDPVSLAQMVTDLVIDAKWRQVSNDTGGVVHQGFKEGLEEIWDPPVSGPGLRGYLEELRKAGPTQCVWFTGHSLGGALAVLAAARVQAVQGVYTFGAPKVGDRKFADSYQVPTYRFVNNKDPVPDLPPSVPLVGHYVHVGEAYRFDAAGTLRSLSASSDAGGWLGDRLGIRLRNPLDHAPICYAIKAWNWCVRQE